MHRIRKKTGAAITDGFFQGMSKTAKLLPIANPVRYQVNVIHDIPFAPDLGSAGFLDLYQPHDAGPNTPSVFYIHGGGFRILNKETHWFMALMFARRGYRVFNINYRKAPEHRFPSAHEDTFRAFKFLIQNADRFGIDADKLIVAGESAGANLALSLSIATADRRPEPFAEELFALGVRPAAVIPQCGYLQISDAARFRRDHGVNRFVLDRLEEVAEAYFPHDSTATELADPLVLLENAKSFSRQLPPMFATVGSNDVLKYDSIRLEKAAKKLGAECETKIYEGGMHAFQAFVFRKQSRLAWRDTFGFLERLGLGV